MDNPTADLPHQFGGSGSGGDGGGRYLPNGWRTGPVYSNHQRPVMPSCCPSEAPAYSPVAPLATATPSYMSSPPFSLGTATSTSKSSTPRSEGFARVGPGSGGGSGMPRVFMASAALDIDTPADLEKLNDTSGRGAKD